GRRAIAVATVDFPGRGVRRGARAPATVFFQSRGAWFFSDLRISQADRAGLSRLRRPARNAPVAAWPLSHRAETKSTVYCLLTSGGILWRSTRAASGDRKNVLPA